MIDLDRVRKGAKYYLKFRGYEIIEDDFEGYIIANDVEENTIAIVALSATEDDIKSDPLSKVTRDEFEQVMMRFFKSHDIVNRSVRCDICDLFVIGSNRAIVRHVVGIDFDM